MPRPVLMWRPEPVTAEDCPDLPLTFRWRRRDFETTTATGPERIAPEWWRQIDGRPADMSPATAMTATRIRDYYEIAAASP